MKLFVYDPENPNREAVLLCEDERQAQFAKSRRHHFPRYCPIRFSYED